MATAHSQRGQRRVWATTPTRSRLGDFNGDGKLDLATANDNSTNVSVLLQPAAPEVGVPATLAFSNQNVGTNNTLSLTITNTGTAELDITGTSVSGTNSADFTAALNTCSSPVSLAATARLT